MPPAYDFKLALTRVIEPTGGSWRRQRRRHASSAALWTPVAPSATALGLFLAADPSRQAVFSFSG